MNVVYVKLWKRLIDIKLGKDEFVTIESISKICNALNCDIGEIIDEENITNNEKEIDSN